MGWTDQSETNFQSGKPARGSQVFQLHQNLLAAWSGSDPAAPKLQTAAILDGAVVNEKLEPAIAGDTYAILSNSDGNDPSSVWIEYAGCGAVIGRAGSYRLKIRISRKNVQAITGYARVYKNGVAIGSEFSAGLDAYFVGGQGVGRISPLWSQDFSFAVGDEISLRVKGSSSGSENLTAWLGFYTENKVGAIVSHIEQEHSMG